MKIVCPHCSFSREVADHQVPDRPVKVTCPKCQQGFSFDKSAVVPAPQEDALRATVTDSAALAVHTEGRTVCPACGLEQPDDESCIGCGVIYAKWAARRDARETSHSAQEAGPSPSAPRVVCKACGAVQTPSHQCINCGVLLVSETDTALPNYKFAGFWIRVAASLIDGVILGLAQFVIGLVLGFAGGDADGLAMFAITSLCSMVISITYYVFFTGYNGQTPGKMALRLQVIRTDGTPVGYGKAFLREIPCKFISGILLGIGYLMVAFDQQKQGLHDRMAGTYVIKL